LSRSAFLPAVVLCCVLALGGSSVSMLHAQTPNLSPQETQREQIYARQAEAWKAFYGGRHEEAISLAAPLLKAPFEWAAMEAAHCQARCYWSMGTSKLRHLAAARKIWDQLKKASTLNANLERLKIAQALQAKADKNTTAETGRQDPAAIEILEEVLKDAFPETCTAEAAIELARRYAESRRFDEAERAYDFATRFLEHQQKLELSPTAAAPFVKAAADGKANLVYLRDAGRRLFEMAEGLRRQDKFVEAVRTYQKVIRKHPQTDYAPRSRLQIGYCLLGTGRVNQALLHWLQFIQDAPSGPWRGQAYLALIDLYLEQRLDIAQAGKYASIARSSLSSALADKTAATSWQLATFDICLRSGIVAFVQGQQQAAAEAFEAALKGTESMPTETRARLNRLLGAAKANKSLLPEDVCGPAGPSGGKNVNGKAATALAISSIYRLSGQLDKAETFFLRVAPMSRKASRAPVAKIESASKAQQAFAVYNLAMIAQARGQTDAALQYYRTSLKLHPAGSWHDATLYCIASIIENRARAEHGSPASSATGAGGAASAKQPSAADRATAMDAGRARLAAYRKARCEALPYWQQLVKRFPQSPYAEPAMYNIGVLFYETDQFTEAAEVLNHFVGAYPQSPWAGDTYVKLIDITLERRFDLPAAQSLTETSIRWVRDNGHRVSIAEEGKQTTEDMEGVWCPAYSTPSSVELKHYCYDAYLCAGVIAYLERNYDLAARMFRESEPFSPPRDIDIVEGNIPTGIECIINAAKGRATLTPPEVLTGDERVSLILRMGDIYHWAQAYSRAQRLYRIIMERNSKQTEEASELQRSWAFFKHGRCRFLRGPRLSDPIGAMADYLGAQEMAPEAPWGYKCLFLAANILFNTNHDEDQAVALWQQMLKQYPDCEEAHRAAYYIGVAYEWKNRPKKARDAYAAFLCDYPQSPFANLVKTYHLAKLVAMETGSGGE